MNAKNQLSSTIGCHYTTLGIILIHCAIINRNLLYKTVHQFCCRFITMVELKDLAKWESDLREVSLSFPNHKQNWFGPVLLLIWLSNAQVKLKPDFDNQTFRYPDCSISERH
jgi:hypothetical protein